MSTAGVSRMYGGVSAEQRTADRRARLLEAGMNLFGSSASGSVRVKDVVAEAGLTERYFYESFADLDALFDAVLDLTIETIERDVNAAVATASDSHYTRVSAALRETVDTLSKDPRMIRIFFVEALGKGDRAGTRRDDLLLRAAHNFFKWSETEVVEFDSSPIETRMKAFAIAGAAAELMITWAEGLLDVTPTELADFLVGLYWRANLP